MTANGSQSNQPSSSTRGHRGLITRVVVLLVVAAAFAFVFVSYGDQLTLSNLVRYETQLRDYEQRHPVLVLGIAFVAYVAVTGLSLPGAAGMTLAYAWLFGFLRALVLVSFASTAGATLAFLLSRYLVGRLVQEKFGGRLESFNRALEREGAFYLFTLRLIPAIPFFVINIVMGLTPMRIWTYWWVSQVGMLAGTCVYVYAGSTVPSLGELAEQGTAGILKWELVAAFVLLGVFPLVARTILRWLRRGSRAK